MSLKRSRESVDGDDTDQANVTKKLKHQGHLPLQFYSKSKDVEARKLSNFAQSWILIEGCHYPSVEHYYQSQKYAAYPSIAATFGSSAEGVPPIVGIEAKDAKSAGTKGAMKKRKIVLDLRKWNIRGPEVMRRGLAAKFAIPAYRAVLQATGARSLQHFERRPGLWGMQTSKETGLIKGANLLGRMLEELRSDNMQSSHAVS